MVRRDRSDRPPPIWLLCKPCAKITCSGNKLQQYSDDDNCSDDANHSVRANSRTENVYFESLVFVLHCELRLKRPTRFVALPRPNQQWRRETIWEDRTIPMAYKSAPHVRALGVRTTGCGVTFCYARKPIILRRDFRAIRNFRASRLQ